MARRIALALALVLSVAAAAAGPLKAAPTSRGVVVVTTNLALQNSSAAGTGIVLTTSGEVLTNNHVIRGATTIKVTVPQTRRTYTARVLGYDIVHDVAVLQLKNASGLATATRGNSATLKVGQVAYAIGNANGTGRLVTTRGRITGLNRTISVQDDSGDVSRLTGLIETSARLVPGDSGGPLQDAAGRVVGLNSAGSSSFSFRASDGYAIPINRALAVARQVDQGRSSATVHVGPTAFVGLQLVDTPQGIGVAAVVAGSPAARAGLARGDLITAVDGKAVLRYTQLRTALFRKRPGDTIKLAWTDVYGNRTSAAIRLVAGPPQ